MRLASVRVPGYDMPIAYYTLLTFSRWRNYVLLTTRHISH